MKTFTKHVTTFLLAIATALSLCLAIVCMNPGKVSATDLSGNLATNAENWQATGDGITFDENGIKITNSSNSAKAVALKTKVNGEATITLKFKASENLGGFQVMFKDARDTVPTAVGYNQGGAGHRLLVDLRRIGDYVANYTVAHYQDGGQAWPNWPGEFVATDNSAASEDGKSYNQYFDGNEHSIIISTVDVENGVKVSVNVGGRQLLSEKVIEDTSLCGEQYISFGCFESVADSELTVTSVTVKVPEPPAGKDFTGNVALKENQWVAKGANVAFDEEGIKFDLNASSGLNIVSTAYKFEANATITLKFKATGSIARFFIQAKDTRDSVPQDIGYSGDNSRIMIQMRRDITGSAHPNYFIQAYDNNGGANYSGENNGRLFLANEGNGLNSAFDGTEHTIIIKTEDVDNGIKLTIKFDTIDCGITEQVIEGERFKGEQYLSFGVVDANPSTFIMTSVEIQEASAVDNTKDFSGNVAVKANQWQINDSKATIDENGITFASETKYESNVSVALLNKISVNSHIVVKFKTNVEFNNFLVQFADTRTSVPSAVGYNQAGNGHRLITDLRGTGDYVANYSALYYQNGGQPFPLYPDEFVKAVNEEPSKKNAYFNGEEQTIIIDTMEVANGLKVSIKVGNIELVSGNVFEDSEIVGDYYLAIGCLSIDAGTSLTVTSVEITENEVASAFGASVRVVDGEFTGFRFNLAFDKEFLDGMNVEGATVTVGAVIAPKWMVDGGTALEIGATDVLNIENDKELFEKDGKYLLNAVITDIGSVTENVNRYKMEFMARAYVKVVAADGTTTIYYGEAITRSIVGVAADALEAQGDVLEADVKSVLERIVNACNA